MNAFLKSLFIHSHSLRADVVPIHFLWIWEIWCIKADLVFFSQNLLDSKRDRQSSTIFKKSSYRVVSAIRDQIRSVAQSCSTLCDPMNCSQASLSITNARSSLRLTSIESVMPSSHLILCCPLLLLPPIPPSIRVFSNESTLRMRWPKYWSFSFSIILESTIAPRDF